ncbi:MAG TPA: 1-acyl-sn-glycerol-3-phosphate acyltransferase [Thermoanaerobaculia bacterium]|nr:1-acyl-sn-glycerol-3-phosphate acyltransferase [Thermoanaerobaculia bacterium]
MTEEASAGYALVRALSRLLLGIFYERFEIVGEENVPSEGPLVVAANHHNSIVDAMILMAAFRRPLRVLANAPLFHHVLVGPFLRLVGALPVNRRQEAGNDPQKNAALFAATTAALRAGHAIALFPEGRTQPEPVLQTVRTGAARMLLAAEAAGARGVTLLPVGLVFDEPGTFRSGSALVLVGSPVETSGLAGRDPAADPAAARALTDRLTGALRAQIVETDDRRTLRLLKLVEELWRDRDDAPAPPEGLRVLWLQGAARAHRTLRQRAPDRVAAFRTRLEAYDSECEKAGLSAEQLSRWYTPASVARYVVSEGLSLLFGLPLALVGLLVHGLPYRLTAFVVRRFPHTDEEEATDKIVGGLVVYPLCWIAEGWAVSALFGKTALIAFLVAIPLTAFPALAWSERLRRVKTEATAFGRFLWDRELLRRLRKVRRELADELHALAALAESNPGAPA